MTWQTVHCSTPVEREALPPLDHEQPSPFDLWDLEQECKGRRVQIHEAKTDA